MYAQENLLPRILHAQRTERKSTTSPVAVTYLTFSRQNSTKRSSLRWVKWVFSDLPFKGMVVRVPVALRTV